MNLQEEYHRRHALSCPLIRRPEKKLCLFYRSDRVVWKSPWVVFTAELTPLANHPSAFTFKWLQPRYSQPSGAAFTQIVPDQMVQWESFEEEILGVARDYNHLTPVLSEDGIFLTAWEMFLFNVDCHLDALSLGAKSLIWKTVDLDFDETMRVKIIHECIDGFRRVPDISNITSRWATYYQLCDLSTYGLWLGDLTLQHRKSESYLTDFRSILDVA